MAEGRRSRLRIVQKRHRLILGKSKIENLDHTASRQKDVFRFEIPMHYASVMGSYQPADDLSSNFQGLRGSQVRTLHPLAERFTFQQLHDRKGHAILTTKVVDGEDVRVRESCDALRLAFEAGMRLGIVRHVFGEDLDGDIPLKPRISGTIHLTHSARAQELADRIGAEIRTFFEFHVTMPLRESIS